MVRVPGEPGVWVFVAAAQMGFVFFLPGGIVWPVVPILSLLAMIAAVIRAYQDAEQLHITDELQPPT
ncbi:hypothetical protein ACIBQX_40820 [Nonomuraea sp. NPDC049714]|uniref:hypothetical protein n=1 Tax=Nonomuraea sp. NPDC049714 TaxID=3364357 RepID=UPI0037AF6660